MKKNLVILVAMLGCGLLPMNLGAISMPHIFADHMVLQRNAEIALWGKSAPKEQITVELNGVKKRGLANASGQWKVVLPPMGAGGPYTLTVSGKSDTLSFVDVLLGEVWICSGQSNMEFRLSSAMNSAKEIADADNYPGLRSFHVGQVMSHVPLNDVEGEWQCCTSATAGDFSAVGYFFARELYRRLGVPIGFINTSWGGTDIESWMSMEAIEQFPKYKRLQERMRSPRFEEYVQRSDENRAKFVESMKEEPGMAEQWYSTSYPKDDWKELVVPGLWSNDDLVAIDGVVWQTCTLELPEEYVGKEAILSLHVIDDDDITWINGQRVGETAGYDVRRLYHVPAGVLKEHNEITLKISDYRGGGGLYGPAHEIYLKIGDKTWPLSGTWRYKVSASSSDFDFVEYGPNAYPSLLYNAMVNALTGLSMRGVIWYQGENNTNRASEYFDLFPALINDWREKWGKEFPFYWVQLANYMEPVAEPGESLWAQVRAAQTQALSLPHTGQAVIIDIGEANDIHPKNKQDVGLRLARHALHKDYGFSDVVCESPFADTAHRVGDKVIVQFAHVAEGLMVKNKYGYLMSFAVAGSDGVYKWVQAKVVGKNRVVLSCPDISTPVSVRYAWGDNPDDANLYNSAGLPATPFEIEIE